VYRAAIGLLQVTVLVDGQSDTQRQAHESNARALLEFFNRGS
jgi:hypothetical protein